MRFQVRAVATADASQIVEVELDAPSEQQARAEALALGLSVLSLQTKKEISSGANAPNWRSSDLAWWCRELRTLIAAGMTAVEALETLQAQAQGQGEARRTVQSQLLDGLHRGLALSQAMEQLGSFPSVLIASVRAAERTSTLGSALNDYLRYHDVLDQMRRRIISAAMYPLLVAGVGFVVCTFLVAVVMPRFLGFLEGTRASQKGVTALLFSLSHWLNAHGGLAILLFVALIASAAWSWRIGLLGKMVHHAAMAIPPIARTVAAFERAQLYQALALLYRGGYPIEEAVGVCRSAAQSKGTQLASQLSVAQASLLRGQGVSRALTAAGLTDEVSRRLLAVGERSGGVDGILQAIAERHSQAVSDFVDRAMRIVEPVLLLVVASLVGSVVVLMYLPIFDIATGLPT
ncbi:MAG: type II secretion system F family protein [Rubrivivax sp.]|nr:MAG: type II secretion system F family protein [Rubrivivax sp.]